jgi:hypothetical protein
MNKAKPAGVFVKLRADVETVQFTATAKDRKNGQRTVPRAIR